MVNDHQRFGGMQGAGLGLGVGSLEYLIRKGRDRVPHWTRAVTGAPGLPAQEYTRIVSNVSLNIW